jgi:enamine deaminase RidA (YjgF/YER057c/UK114 family)
MTPRTLISSGTKWEDIVGYSRAIRVGNRVLVTGTTAVDASGDLVGRNDAYAQTAFILEKIGKALAEAGASFEHVVRTRMYVTDISRWEEIARAHGEVFRTIKPCATMVEVSRLIEPGMLIEIEAEAEL